MDKFRFAVAVAVSVWTAHPSKAQQPPAADTCVETGRSKLCYETKLAGLNMEFSATLVTPADAAIELLTKAGVSDQKLVDGCRVMAGNPAAQTDAIFSKLPRGVLAQMKGARIVGTSRLEDGRMRCQYQSGVLSGTTGPYTMRGNVPKQIAPCAQKLIDRTNTAALTVKRQSSSTMFFESDHYEFTARCALHQNEITAALTGAKICNPTLADVTPLFDMIGAPDKDRKKLLSLASTGMRKSKRSKNPSVAKWNDYELTTSDTGDECILIVYPPMPELKG